MVFILSALLNGANAFRKRKKGKEIRPQSGSSVEQPRALSGSSSFSCYASKEPYFSKISKVIVRTFKGDLREIGRTLRLIVWDFDTTSDKDMKKDLMTLETLIKLRIKYDSEGELSNKFKGFEDYLQANLTSSSFMSNLSRGASGKMIGVSPGEANPYITEVGVLHTDSLEKYGLLK